MKKFIFIFLLISSFTFSGWNEGVQLFKEKKYREAIPHFQQVVEAIPEGSSGHYMLGLCYLYLGELDKASESLKKAAQLKPEDGDAAHKYLTVLMKQKKYDVAHNFAKNYREEYIPKELRGDFYKMAGLASLKSGDFEKAMNFLQKAEALMDGDEVPYYLGLAALQSQNYDLAVSSFQKAYSRNPKNSDALFYKSKALIEQGRIATSPEEKIRYYNMALQEGQKLIKEKESFENYMLLGEAALGAQKYEEAIGFFEKAKGLNKNDGFLYLYIGQAKSSLDKYDEAINYLNQAANLLPEDKKRVAYNQIGFVYDKKKDYQKAIEFYKKAGNDKKVKEVEDKIKMEEQNRKADEALKEYEKKKAEQEKKK